jgi:DNA-binding beta-propeller fold protein YncE
VRRLLIVLAVAVALVPGAISLARDAAPLSHARVTQLSDTAGCVQDPIATEFLDEDEKPDCVIAKALATPTDVAVTPDGKQVYVTASGSGSITWLARNGDTGQITFAGCLSDDGGTGLAGSDGQCTDGDSIDGPRAVALSPDGASLYAAASTGGVLSFSRNGDTGQLQQLGCIRDHVEEGDCLDRFALGGVRGITVSPDGKNVYAVAAGSDSIIRLDRDTSTGALTFRDCISDDGTNGLCTDGEAMRGANGVAVSPDGKSVYVSAGASGSVLSFRRDTDTGELTQTGCELNNAPPGPCDRAQALAGASSVAISPDGKTVFATAPGSSAVSAFRRDADTGLLTEAGCITTPDTKLGTCTGGSLNQPTSAAVGAASGELIVTGSAGTLVSLSYDPSAGTFTRTSCVTSFESEDCTVGRALGGAASVAVSPDGRNAYVAATSDNAVDVFAEGATVPARSGAVRRGVVRVPLDCPRRAAGGCRGTIELRAAGTATKRFRLRAGRSAAFAVRLSPRSQRAVARHRHLRARLTIRERGRALPPLDRDFVLEAGR